MASLPDKAKGVKTCVGTREGEELPSSKLVSMSSFSTLPGVSNLDDCVNEVAEEGMNLLCEKAKAGLLLEDEVHGLLEDELAGRNRLDGAGVWRH